MKNALALIILTPAAITTANLSGATVLLSAQKSLAGQRGKIG